MKIGILTDIHANLPAFQKALEIFQQEHCERIIHCGDLMAIGPYPKECVDLAFSIPHMEFIMGNHDYWYGYGLPHPIPKWMSQEEVDHQNWTHLQIGDRYKKFVKKWKFTFTIQLPDAYRSKVTFMHYALNENQNWFQPHVHEPDAKILDKMFERVEGDYVFYGHNHLASDISGKKRYLNLGSAGCYDRAEVRLAILEIIDSKCIVRKMSVPYDDNGFMEAFEERQVPAREFITKNFITR